MRQHQLKEEIENLNKGIERKRAEIVDMVWKKEYYTNLAQGLTNSAARTITDMYMKGLSVVITSPEEMEPPTLKVKAKAKAVKRKHGDGGPCYRWEEYGKIIPCDFKGDDCHDCPHNNEEPPKAIGTFKEPVKVTIEEKAPRPENVIAIGPAVTLEDVKTGAKAEITVKGDANGPQE